MVLFEDEPSRTTMRAQHMSDHLAFLERNAHSVRSAGPLVDAVDESGAGGLWLVEAENLQGCRHSTSQTRFGRPGCANPSGCCDGTRSSLTGGALRDAKTHVPSATEQQMTRWVAIFDDHPESEAGWIRRRHAQAHFAYLAENRHKVLLGGGLRLGPEEWYCGGLWVIEVDSRDEAVALCENDPYFRLGLRKGYSLYVWGKAPCYQEIRL